LKNFFKLIFVLMFLSGANIIERIKATGEFNEVELSEIVPIFEDLNEDSLELFNVWSLSTEGSEQLNQDIKDKVLLNCIETKEFKSDRIGFLRVLYSTLIHSINYELKKDSFTMEEIVDIAETQSPKKYECLCIIATKILEPEKSPSPQKPSPQLLRRSSSISGSNQSSISSRPETSEKNVSITPNSSK